jgi:hypothetical protein
LIPHSEIRSSRSPLDRIAVIPVAGLGGSVAPFSSESDEQFVHLWENEGYPANPHKKLELFNSRAPINWIFLIMHPNNTN